MIITIIIFLIVLAVLIFVHELGHFLMARAFGIRVDEFAVGFGPKIWSKQGKMKNGTSVLYSLRAIPFGGYVKIYGEDGEVPTGDSVPVSNSFAQKNRGIQALVLFAGILFNFIFAWIIISFAFMIGAPVSPDSYTQYASQIRNEHVVVADVLKGSPAEKAGFKTGDTISNLSMDQIQTEVNASHGQPILINGISVTPVLGLLPADVPNASTTYAVGIDMETAGTLQLPPWSAGWEGAKFTLYIVEATAQGVWGLIVGLFQNNHAVLAQVSGPVGIAGIVGNAARAGFADLLLLVGLISVNLGVINLIPFPALDGGRILFVALEAISRRRIPEKIAGIVNTIGFALLILLMLVVTWHDIVTRL